MSGTFVLTPYKFGCYTFLRSRERVFFFFVKTLWLKSCSNFQVLAFLQKYLERLDRFFLKRSPRMLHNAGQFYSKVSLTLIHWNILDFNDKEGAWSDGKVCATNSLLTCYANMFSSMRATLSSVINWQIFHAFDLHTFWKGNGKRQKWPRDHDFSSFTVCRLFLRDGK